MKCIQLGASLSVKVGNIQRVTDQEANRLVSSGLAIYVPKSLWKEQNNRNKKTVSCPESKAQKKDR